MSRPATIKFAIGLLESKISFYIICSVFIAWVLHMRPDLAENSGLDLRIRAFIKGAADGLIGMSKLEGAYNKDPSYAVNFIVVGYVFILIRSAIVLFFLLKRRRVAFWVAFVVDALLTLKNGFPIFSIIVLAIMYTKSARDFFKAMRIKT
ncbi:MAG: hypothetical protein ABJN36_07060 [Cyclobacteriaceae bacterium]